MLDICCASNTKLKVFESTTPHLCMGENLTRVHFGFVRKLVVTVLLGTTHIDKVTKSIPPSKQRNCPLPRPVGADINVNEAGSEAEMEKSATCQRATEDLALLVTTTRCDQKYFRVGRQVVLKEMCETPVLDSTKSDRPERVIFSRERSRKSYVHNG